MDDHKFYQKGVNIIGYFNRCLGLTHSANSFIRVFQSQGIPFSRVSIEPFNVYINDKDQVAKQLIYPINIFCSDICDSHFIEALGWKQFKNYYNIGVYFWETDSLPVNLRWSLYGIDEIWATSRYVQENISKAVKPLPVYHIPQPVCLPDFDRERVISNPFTFLFCFDFASDVQRKNPFAIVQAFKNAFPNCPNVQLTIKSQNGHKFPDQLQRLHAVMNHDSRIKSIEEVMEFGAFYRLMDACDCYVSLHRSEGFGLTMAEAMLLGKPVIATGYSGNLDFMNHENSFLCSYRLTEIGKGSLYPKKGTWAEVDVDHASYLMKQVYSNPEEAKQKAQKGFDFMHRHHTVERVGFSIQARLSKISVPIEPKKVPVAYFPSKLFHSVKYKIKNCIKRSKGA